MKAAMTVIKLTGMAALPHVQLKETTFAQLLLVKLLFAHIHVETGF